MNNIAVLLTCHNRRDKTILALQSLEKAYSSYSGDLNISVYLTDDGSTDGTADAVSQKFPETIILKGDGNLFWANGMINSWSEAVKNNHDGYLLLNDDTFLLDTVFDDLKNTHEYAIKTFGTAGVYIGSTKDPDTGKLSYGGGILTNKLLYRFKILTPNGEFQECDLGNANIMFVDDSVIEKVGILSEGYEHGLADYDYTLKAKRKNIPVLVAKNYCGLCERDNKGLYHNFESKSLKERIDHLYKPTGIAFKSRLLFMKRFFPYRVPVFYVMGWFKVLFPRLYVRMRFK
ncbi:MULTISPECIES: glycosyltransferase family 2 protein [Flavobacteriaceae]|uniref:glycosyltransferase family 2 protein n=1 Tax=Flavobacteriaceae TaxID=49546 RepID=UPI001491C69E|nr:MULTISPECIES: glycosyltransferase family 2 protein [Allomuricauda]MDC6366871.1 glycosyltransferase family 2 protein [Muricauda sp. AC10]